jgi:hypothetical protein
MFRQVLGMTRYDNSAQLPPWEHKEAIGTTRVRWRYLNQDTDETRVGIFQLSTNYLLLPLENDICEMPNVQLPRGCRYRLHLNQSMPALVINSYDVVRRHVASERGCDKSTPRQLGCDNVFAGLFRQVCYVQWPYPIPLSDVSVSPLFLYQW